MQIIPEPPMKLEEPEDFFLNNQECLENGIPLSPEVEKDILFNFNENSQISTYSKL